MRRMLTKDYRSSERERRAESGNPGTGYNGISCTGFRGFRKEKDNQDSKAVRVGGGLC